MRNILFLGAIASLTACGLSEDKFQDESLAETCRILVLCEVYADAAECESELGDMEVDETCTYNADAAKDCLDELKAVEECPTGSFGTACENVYTDCEGTDSGM